jgi:sugar-specific transcriptional regulator TrmB
MISKVFQQLGIPENAIHVYEQLMSGGALTARQLSEQLGLPRPSVYDYLKLLQRHGLVVERSQDNKKVFQLDDVRHLPQLVQQKIEQLASAEKQLRRDLPQLLKRSQSVEPKIKFYPGVDGVKQIFLDALWEENVAMLSMWPMSEMIQILGKEFHENFHRRRIRQHISIRTLWPRDRNVPVDEYPYLGTGKRFLREQRLAPSGMTWDMGYLLYKQKVGFISPQREAFGLTLQSQAFTDLMRVQFEVMWKISKAVQASPKNSEKFLRTV